MAKIRANGAGLFQFSGCVGWGPRAGKLFPKFAFRAGPGGSKREKEKKKIHGPDRAYFLQKKLSA